MRKRTVKLYRLNEDGRKLFAGTIQSGSPLELVTHWRALGLEAADEASHVAMAA